MVKVGNFTIELVEAEKKSIFKEHECQGNGKIYAEVEPDIEYFIRLSSSDNKPVYVNVTVDGDNIETGRLLRANDTVLMGFHSDIGESFHETALKFKKADFVATAPRSSLWTGIVTAEFFDHPDGVRESDDDTSIEDVTPPQRCTINEDAKSTEKRTGEKDIKSPKKTTIGEDTTLPKRRTGPSSSGFPSKRIKVVEKIIVEPMRNLVYCNWQPKEILSRKEDSCRHRKGVKTIQGEALLKIRKKKKKSKKPKKSQTRNSQSTSIFKRQDPPKIQETRMPKLFRKIELNYCSTIGLILVGVLPKPPLWDFYGLQHPPEPKDIKNYIDLDVIRKKYNVVTNIDGKEICVEKEYFDLSSLEKDVVYL